MESTIKRSTFHPSNRAFNLASMWVWVFTAVFYLHFLNSLAVGGTGLMTNCKEGDGYLTSRRREVIERIRREDGNGSEERRSGGAGSERKEKGCENPRKKQ
ncbi:hypothetical protein L2E82_35668 [Cichorium intybus]|uniref:Uncharacterized protein n=1 Tax=Cichorium intybus TaxID=13427 RepID=A0ACB9BPE8_CICIN|nr:hypothetical protein L2E82_35668 [Cichorium intybus]